jgi:GTP cyclohydrolase IA
MEDVAMFETTGSFTENGRTVAKEDLQSADEQRPRRVSDDQMRRFEAYAGEIFTAFGMNLDAASTKDTPRRFIRALWDVTAGYDGDPKLTKAFETECRGDPACKVSQVIEGPIPFHAHCEHHALPFFGQAYVGYIASNRIIGISKLTRLVRLFARRFTVQERIGQQIVAKLHAMMEPYGVAVCLNAHHLCTQMRGVSETSPMTRTTHWQGEYVGSAALRTEFLAACGLKQ